MRGRNRKSTGFAAVTEESDLEKKDAEQKANRAIERKKRRFHRADQRTGALVARIPDEIRGRVMRVVDEIVNDRRKLEACERVLRKRDEPELVAAEAAE